MRKIFLVLGIVILFCVFAGAGYNAAVNGGSDDPNKIPPKNGPIDSSQENILFVLTEKIDPSNAALKGLWVGYFFKSSNQTVLRASQLYPPQDPGIPVDDLVNTFNVNPDGSPTAAFLHKLTSRGIQWKSYIVVEEAATQLVGQWLLAQGMPAPGENFAGPTVVITACDYINTERPSTSPPLRINWDALTPHIQSSYSYSELMGLWDTLMLPARPTRCEILPQTSP